MWPSEIAGVPLVVSTVHTTFGATSEYMLVCGEINTPASIGAAISKAQDVLEKNSSRKRLNAVHVALPWLCLLDLHPDNLRLCYGVIRIDALLRGATVDVLGPLYSTERSSKNPATTYANTLYHELPHLILKCLMLAEAGAILAHLDALLLSKNTQWKDAVIMVNLLPFLWPKHHCFERNALAARGGRKRLGTVGDLRAAHAVLLSHVQVLSCMLIGRNRQLLLKLLLGEQAPTHFQGRPIRLSDHIEVGSAKEVHIIAKMFHPVLHNKRYPLVAQVQRLLTAYLE
jgi:hypothetical protein